MRTHTKRRRRNQPGIQHLWGFDNGQLASAVPDDADVTRWAVTVLDGSGRPQSRLSGSADVIGSLRPNDVRRILREIEAKR